MREERGLTDYELSYYGFAKEDAVTEAVANGYGIIRIKQGKRVELCRVALQAKGVKVM